MIEPRVSKAELRGSKTEPVVSKAELRGSMIEPVVSKAELRGSMIEPTVSMIVHLRSFRTPIPSSDLTRF
ncbi:MAG: hypothetical protein LBL06_01945 [Treponema sp.]|nr:hypothetical protein [Treponema sp.]